MEKPNEIYINQLSGDNSDFRASIISILKKELPEEIATYKKKLGEKNLQQTAACVHKLKHKISILGMEKSYYIAEEYEKKLLNQSIELQNEFENILNTMQEFVDQL